MKSCYATPVLFIAGIRIACIAKEHTLNGATLRVAGDPAPLSAFAIDRLGPFCKNYTAYQQKIFHMWRFALSTRDRGYQDLARPPCPQARDVGASWFRHNVCVVSLSRQARPTSTNSASSWVSDQPKQHNEAHGKIGSANLQGGATSGPQRPIATL